MSRYTQTVGDGKNWWLSVISLYLYGVSTHDLSSLAPYAKANVSCIGSGLLRCKYPVRPGESCVTFYDPASDDMQYHFHHNPASCIEIIDLTSQWMSVNVTL